MISKKYVFNCLSCGKEHLAFEYTKGRKKYCSRKCMEQFRHTPLDQLVKQNYQIKENGCWEWTNSIVSRTGYGKIGFKGKTLSAHRASYEVHKGKIPKGKHVCHSCDNRKCINPNHLWLGTQKENIQDCAEKGRLPKICINNRKHSEEIVKYIIKLKEKGKTYIEIHRITNVPIGTCSAYVNGHRRKK